MAAAGDVAGTRGQQATLSDLSYGLQFSDCHLDDWESAAPVAAITILMPRGVSVVTAPGMHDTVKCDTSEQPAHCTALNALTLFVPT